MTKKEQPITYVDLNGVYVKKEDRPYTFASPSKKVRKGLLPAGLAALVAIFGVAKGITSLSKRASKEPASITQMLQDAAQSNPLPTEEMTAPISEQVAPEQTPSTPEALPENPTQNVATNSVTTQLFSQVSAVAPQGTSTNTLWLCAELLEKLSTGTNGVCMATNMPRQNFTNFVSRMLTISTNELQKAQEGTTTNAPLYSFKGLSDALINQTTNTTMVAQQAFLLAQRYQVHDFFADEVPTYEGNTSFIYWDSAGVPTVYKGINLQDHPNVLSAIRIKNSEKLRKLLPHISEKEEYVTLSAEDLETLTKDVKAKGYVGKPANDYEELYGLSVHPDDLPTLEPIFQKKVAQFVKRAENTLEKGKPASLANESVLFGSYTNPVPKEAIRPAVDICYNTWNDLRKLWPNFTAAFEKRDFVAAKSEALIKDGQATRNTWHQTDLQAAADIWQQQQAARQAATQQQTPSASR